MSRLLTLPSATLNLENAARVAQQLVQALQSPEARVQTNAKGSTDLGSAAGSNEASYKLDLAGLQQFDSAALSVLLELKRAVAKQPSAGSLTIENPPANLKRLAQLYGVDTLLF